MMGGGLLPPLFAGRPERDALELIVCVMQLYGTFVYLGLWLPLSGRFVDDRHITHLICVHLRHLLYDFFRACFGPFLWEKNNRPQTPPPKVI